MLIPFSSLLALKTGRMDWRVKVRVIRMWNVESELLPGRVNSIELILLDIDGNKIQATIPSHCVERFTHVFREFSVYILTIFHVSESLSCSNATGNRHKITLHPRTNVVLDDSFLIHRYGLSCIKTDAILRPRFEYFLLVDFIGLLTALHYEYVLDDVEGLRTVGKLELTDERGKICCDLKGPILNHFKELLKASYVGLPLVVLQFAQIVRSEGSVVLEGYKSITRIMLNPPVAECVEFKNRLVLCGGRIPINNGKGPANSPVSNRSEFTHFHHARSIHELIKTPETGIAVVCAKIVGCFQVDQWWHPMCDCGKAMVVREGLYRCLDCNRTTFSVRSKCMLRVVVDDGEATATFELCDYMLQDIPSLNYNELGVACALSGKGLEKLKEKEVLFVVRKLENYVHLAGHPFEVINLTNDEGIVNTYKLFGKNYTPAKCIFKPPFAYMSPVIPYPGMGSNDQVGSSSGKSPLMETSSSSASLDDSDEAGAGTSSSGHRRELLPSFHAVEPSKDGVELNH